MAGAPNFPTTQYQPDHKQAEYEQNNTCAIAGDSLINPALKMRRAKQGKAHQVNH
jgi:hypothetical protein